MIKVYKDSVKSAIRLTVLLHVGVTCRHRWLETKPYPAATEVISVSIADQNPLICLF